MICDGVYNEHNLVLENGVFTMKKNVTYTGIVYYCILTSRAEHNRNALCLQSLVRSRDLN